jgi:hypothetical protein
MKDKLQEILAMLRKDYNQRLELINDNNKDISNTPITQSSIDMKLELDELNKELRKKNNSNIELQKAIDKYLKDSCFSFESNKPLSYEEAFQLTITKDLDYDQQNPFFFDYGFYMDLLEFFIEKEDYEMCHKIKKKRTNISGLS